MKIRNSKKKALAFLESQQDIWVDNDVCLNYKDFEFYNVSRAVYTKSRYYRFVTKERIEHNYVTLSGDRIYSKQYYSFNVRISDHEAYNIESDCIEFDGHYCSIQDIYSDEERYKATNGYCII